MLVTGHGLRNMDVAIRLTLEIILDPKIEVIAGIDASNGSIFGDKSATTSVVDKVFPINTCLPKYFPRSEVLTLGVRISINEMVTNGS